MERRTYRAALRWSAEARVERADILAAAIGMAGPVVAGAATAHLGAGLAACVGSLMVAPTGAGQGGESRPAGLRMALIAATAAAVTASLAAGRGWLGDAVVLLLVGAAALVGSYSRPFATATTRFIFFVLIAMPAAEGSPDRRGFLLLLLAGALWTTLANRVLGRWLPAKPREDGEPGPAPQRQVTSAQRLARWRRSLKSLAGWQYALRLTACLAIADAPKWLWSGHHLHWIALTVALLIERQIDAFPVRTVERSLGTILGVLATGLLIVLHPPAWALVAGIAALAGARPFLRARSYLAYSAVMTPLIMILLDAGAPPEAGLLIDRLITTLIGAGLVIGANLIMGKALGSPD